MKNIITTIVSNVSKSICNGVQDVFSTASGALIAVVVAILLSILPTFILVLAAIALFVGIVYTQYQDTLDSESK